MKFCKVPFEDLVILPRGEVYLCPWAIIKVGNIIEDSVENIWNSENTKKLRESILDGSYCYCDHEFCPHLSRDVLPDLADGEIKDIVGNTGLRPHRFSLAYDPTCNHICPSCRSEVYRPEEDEKDEMRVITEKIKPYLNDAERIITNGAGEIFASSYIMPLLEELKPNNPEFAITFETNGVLFNEKNWERIKHLREYYIRVNVTPNSFSEDVYRYLWGGHNDNELDELFKSLRFISELRKEGSINHIQVNFVMQESNFREAPEFCQRAIDEFAADGVSIKPLNRWYDMSKDSAWFKDVLNPLHPYHQEYLYMKEDQRLNNPKVTDWSGGKDHKAKAHPAYEYKIYSEILYKLLECEDPYGKLQRYFKEMGVNSVAIYGAWDLGIKTYEILKRSGIDTDYYIDKFNGGTKCCGIDVKSLHAPGYMDAPCIVVSLIIDYEDVLKDLRQEGYKGKVLSLQEMVKESIG